MKKKEVLSEFKSATEGEPTVTASVKAENNKVDLFPGRSDAAATDLGINPEGMLSEPMKPVATMTPKQRGQHLAARFKDERIHPVLIFGGFASGKTSFLTSLFQYIRVGALANATILQDLDVIPSDTPEWMKMRGYATRVFNRQVFDAIRGEVVKASQEDLPFFLPVSLSPNGQAPKKFAFLEGRGEWYMPDMNADTPHQQFQGEVEGLLQGFNEPVTVIHVAPFTSFSYKEAGGQESSNSNDLNARDLGLLGALGQYERLRRANYHNDKHIFLFTKWDVQCQGIADKQFIRPDPHFFENIIHSRYPLSFSFFKNMRTGSEHLQKVVTNYCSGVMEGNAIQPTAAEDQGRLNYFPRKIWNLLYYNTTRQPLYKDVHTTPPNIFDKIVSWLTQTGK